MLPFTLFSKFIVHTHLLEKLFAYYMLAGVCCTATINLEQASINYTGSSILQGKNSKCLLIYLLHAFFIEKLSCSVVVNSYARHSISDFSISSGQLLGFSSSLRAKFLHSFMTQYIYNSILHEKGFDGLILNNISCAQFSFIHLVVHNIYVFPEISKFFEQVNEFFGNQQLDLSVNICISTKSILGILLFFTHLQVAFKVNMYYDFL